MPGIDADDGGLDVAVDVQDVMDAFVDIAETGPCPFDGGMTFCPLQGFDNVGTCTDLTADPMNCGACGVTCYTGGMCMGGQCTCAIGQSLCPFPGGAFCFDLQTNTNNCGTCGNSCAHGTCSGGVCLTCGPGFVSCGNNTCVSDLFNDIRHCGSCTADCSDGGLCIVNSAGQGIGCQ
jgi:hypothetical protein